MHAAKEFGLAFRMPGEALEQYKKFGIDLAESSGGKNQDLLPVPAVYVLDEKAVVQFSYVNPNYRVRIPAGLVLEAAKTF